MEKTRLEQIDSNEWRFEQPAEFERYDGRLDEAIELMYGEADERAEAILRDIIAQCPEYLDAYHHLAIVLDEQGQDEEALRLWEQAVEIGESAFPEGFAEGDNRLEWRWLENRPFLRAYNGLALAYFERGDAETAARMFEQLLVWDPTDSQGARALAIAAYLSQKRPEKVLEVTRRYEGDNIVDTLYGRVLAHLQLGQREQARDALQTAIEKYPLVAKELAKPWHKPPKGMKPDMVTVGGADEAYAYWQYVGRYWRETPGALDFVREELARLQA